MQSKWLVWTIVAVALAAGAYLGLRPGTQAKGIVNVDASKVSKLIGDSAIRIVDVRTTGEFAAGHLTGAESVPLDQLQSAVSTWDRSKALLVYCATGSRSAEAVQELQGMGFKTIYHFSQGLVAWQGTLDTGAGGAVAKAPAVKTHGTPIMYEFYTDW